MASAESSTATDERTAAVTEILRSSGELGADQTIAEVSQLSGGWSRHAWVARADDGRRYIVRVEAPGGVLESDIRAEYELYRALGEAPQIATPAVYGFAGSADNPFHNRFIVMEFVDGYAPNAFRAADRDWLAHDWLSGGAIARDMVENLARLHQLDPAVVTGGAVPTFSYLEAVDRWQAVYEERRMTRDPVTEEAFVWLRERVPPDTWRGIVHGDYRVGNCLHDAGHVTAILDWELAYIGDVRFDLGYISLERLAGKHLRPVTHMLNAFSEREWFFAEYERLSGRTIDREVIRTFSVLAIMMLLSTHYMGVWMYTHGRSTDFRLLWNRFGVIGLRQDLTKLMDW